MKAARPEVFQQFTVPVRVTFRQCVKDDLPALEWYGLFHEHRAIIRSAFKGQLRGQGLMLLAEVNHFPIGQVWLDLTRKAAERCGRLWACRVIPPFQCRGIGARLLSCAEAILRRRGFVLAEVGVEKDNPNARRFYERQGYRQSGAELEIVRTRTPAGRPLRMRLDQWLLSKPLLKGAK